MSLFKHEFHEDKSDEYATPRSVVEPLAEAVGGFDLDPASGAEPQPHAAETYTEQDDGLAQPWFGTVWLNPPFSKKEAFVEKARQEVLDGRAELVIVLLPVDVSTDLFQNQIASADVLCFRDKRLSFDGGGGRNRNPNFGVLFAVWAQGDVPEELVETLEHRGVVFRSADRIASTRQSTLARDSTEAGSDGGNHD